MSFEHGMAISRRRACGVIGGLVAACALGGLSGCDSAQSDSHSRTGFASDTEVKDYDLTIKLILDSNLKRGLVSDNGLGRVESYISRYQEQNERGGVSIAVKYYSSAEMAGMAQTGFEEADGIIGLQGAVNLAVQTGVAYGGGAGTSVRDFTGQLYEQVTIVRATGSSVEMPKADTISGNDSSDGQFTRIQHLPDFDGKIAVPGESLMEGALTNRNLYRWGFYSEETGLNGTYADSIKDKMVVYNSLDEEVKAITEGTCQLGFVAKSMLWGSYGGIESVYDPGYSNMIYSGASLANAAEGGVARDFFEYITRCI